MEEATERLVRAGGEDGMVSDFRAVAESTAPDGGLRHAPRPTLDWLSRFVVGQAGGPNKDAPLYEFCHLVNALLLADPRADTLPLFFLSPDRVTPAYARDWFDGRTGPGLTFDGDEVALAYGEETFSIRYGRMPALAALYEFLCGMESYAFYPRLEEIVGGIADRPGRLDAVKRATNALSSEMRRYRRAHMESARHEGKFTAIVTFLRDRDGDPRRLTVDDAAILDFWLLHGQGKEYRGYRTVFDLFVTFSEALDAAGARTAVSGAAPLGTDREAGELDVADTEVADAPAAAWRSPLDDFDQPPLNGINFFKKSSERKPMEALMRYGPHAVRLPLAFLRYESFGQVQAGITNDLQVGRGNESVARRLTCNDAEPYAQRQQTLRRLADHCLDLEKATLYAIRDPDDTVVPFPGTERSFAGISRKGFEAFGDRTDGVRRDVFRHAAGHIVAVADGLEKFLDQVNRLDSADGGLDGKFEADRAVFSAAFVRLYGEST